MATALDLKTSLASDILEKKERISLTMSVRSVSDFSNDIEFCCLKFHGEGVHGFSTPKAGVLQIQNSCCLSAHLKHEKFGHLAPVADYIRYGKFRYGGDEKIWDALGETLRDISFNQICISQPSPDQQAIQAGSKIVNLSQFGKLTR